MQPDSPEPIQEPGPTLIQDSQENWYAVRVKSRCEKTVGAMVAGKGFKHFLAFYQRERRWSDRVKQMEFPLFPGYIFCRLNPQHRLPVLTIPGVLNFVGVGKAPVAIDDAEIAAIQNALKSGLPVEPWPYLEIGQRVRLENGPLAGMEGIIAGHSKHDRLVVSITLLKRSVAVTIESRWVRSADESSSSLPMRSGPRMPHSLSL